MLPAFCIAGIWSGEEFNSLRAMWNLIDGKRSVKEIAELLAEHFNHKENDE